MSSAHRSFSFLAFLALFLTPAIVTARPQGSVADESLLASANKDRATQGLAPFEWDPALATAAHQHALRMAKMNQLSHQFPGEPSLQDRARQAVRAFQYDRRKRRPRPNPRRHSQSMDELSSASRQSSRSHAKLRRYLRGPVRQHAVRRRRLLHGRARVFPGSTGAQSRLSTRLAGPGCSDWNAGRPQNLPTR